MIDTYGHVIVEKFCGEVKEVNLYGKLLRPQHVGSLMAAVEKHQVVQLSLRDNQLGPEGGAKLAEALKTNTTLTLLWCALAALEPMPSARSCGRAPGDPPSPLRAQPLAQRTRRLRQAGRPKGLGRPRPPRPLSEQALRAAAPSTPARRDAQ